MCGTRCQSGRQCPRGPHPAPLGFCATAGALRVGFHQRRRLPHRARRPTTRPADPAGTAHRPVLNGSFTLPPPARAMHAAAAAAGAHPSRGAVEGTRTSRRGDPRCSRRRPGPGRRHRRGCVAPLASRDARRAGSRTAAAARYGRRPAWRNVLRKQPAAGRHSPRAWGAHKDAMHVRSFVAPATPPSRRPLSRERRRCRHGARRLG